MLELNTLSVSGSCGHALFVPFIVNVQPSESKSLLTGIFESGFFEALVIDQS